MYLLFGLFILQCLNFLFLLQMSAGNPPSMKIDVNRRLQESATAGNFFLFLKIKLFFQILIFKYCKYLGISDSGYLSHATEDVTNNAYLSHEALSEQTINAMLKPHGFRGKIFIVIFTTIHVSTIHDSIRGVRIQLG